MQSSPDYGAAVPSPDAQVLVALDLEGVLTPEIWPSIGELLGISSLARTTRDTGDYPSLLQERLAVVERHRLGLAALQGLVARLDPLPGGLELLDLLRARWPVVVVSDTFEQLAQPLLDKLGRPFVLCHRLRVEGDVITGAPLRRPDAKPSAVRAFQAMGYRVVAAGDSHNDLAMLRTADRGCLVRPPASLRSAGLAIAEDLSELRDWLDASLADLMVCRR